MWNFFKSFLNRFFKAVDLTLFLTTKLGHTILSIFEGISKKFSPVFKLLKVPLSIKLNLQLPKPPYFKILSFHRRLKKLKKKMQIHLYFGLGFCLAIILVMIPYQIYSWYKTLPSPDLLVIDASKKPTKILDRKGRVLYEIYEGEKSEPIKLSDISPDLINATLALEDHAFYSHFGIRPQSILRAAKATLVDDYLQGGSTITQQLVKNVLLSPERTLTRKLKEMVLAFLVEIKYSKNEILELYLNNISYGGTALGIQSASQKFFGKNASELSLPEATLLAGLPTSPTVLSPVNGGYELAKFRQTIVLNRMVSLGFVSPEKALEAQRAQLTFVPQTESIRAPHFVHYIREKVEKELGTRYVVSGGLSIQTTLDLDLQNQVQDIVKKEIYQSGNLGISNGAALVIAPQTGKILAYVGSIDYFKPVWGSYDLVRANRQPGSSVKPFTYALALSKGYTSATYIEDSPLTVKNEWETYTPNNYDGKFHGTVTLRSALANSYNIPAVKLVQKFGADNMVQLSKDMGLTSWNVDSSYGLSVTLGGKETSLLDLTNAYGTFAREGMYIEPRPIISITDDKGHELFYDNANPIQVLSSEVSYLISSILWDNLSRAPSFGYNSKLVIPNKTVAVKTGTTDYKRDNWTIGYTPDYVVGVWVGNNDNTPMNVALASGLSGAAPIWNSIMTLVLNSNPSGLEMRAFKLPDGIIARSFPECALKNEFFMRGAKIPATICPKIEKSKQANQGKTIN